MTKAKEHRRRFSKEIQQTLDITYHGCPLFPWALLPAVKQESNKQRRENNKWSV